MTKDTVQPRRSNRVRAAFVRLFGRPCRKQYLVWLLAVALWVGLFLGLCVVVPPVPRWALTHLSGHKPTLSPDEKSFATAEGLDPEHPDTIRVWDLATGRRRIDIPRSTGRQWDPITFSPDGKLLLAQDDSGYLAVWETTTGTKVEQFGKHIDFGVREDWDFSPDGRFIFLVNRYMSHHEPFDPRYAVRLWDVETKKFRKTCFDDLRPPMFSPDGKQFARFHDPWGPQLKVELWSLDDGFSGAGPVKVHDVCANKVAFTPTLDTFATARHLDDKWSSIVQLWDMATGDEKDCLAEVKENSGRLGPALTFSPNGRFVLYQTPGRTVIWEVASGLKEVATVSDRLILSRDDRWLITTSDNNPPELFDTATFQKHGTLWRAGDNAPYNGPQPHFAPDGKTVLVNWLIAPKASNPIADLLGQYIAWFKPSGRPHVARLWDVETATELAVFDNCNEGYYSPDAKTLLTVHEGGTLKLWDVQSHKPFLQITLGACFLWLMVIVGLELWGRLIRWRSSKGLRHLVPPITDGAS